MTNEQITVSRELLRNLLKQLEEGAVECWVEEKLRAALEQPGQEPVAHATVRPLRPDECEPKVVIKWVNRPVAGPLYTAPQPVQEKRND